MTVPGLNAAIDAGRSHLQPPPMMMAAITPDDISRGEDEKFIRFMEDKYRHHEEAFGRWKVAALSGARKIESIAHGIGRPLEQMEIQATRDMSDTLTGMARDRAMHADVFIADIKGQSAEMAATAPSRSRFLRRFVGRCEDLRDREVEFMCELSDFFRALARYHDPENTRSEILDDVQSALAI